MALSIIDAGLAWGVPVRPDLLGEHLEAYKKSLPTINTLRLCQRFGQGPGATITKLPVEILLAIEKIIFENTRSAIREDWVWPPTGWVHSFCHYEGRCEPSDHDTGENTPLYETAADDCRDEFCDKCKAGETYHFECDVGCDDLVRTKINEYLWDADSGWCQQECYDLRAQWVEMIDQKPRGNFVKFDKVRPNPPRAFFHAP